MLECILFHLNVKCLVQCSGLFHFSFVSVRSVIRPWTFLIVWMRFDNVFTSQLTFRCLRILPVRLDVISCAFDLLYNWLQSLSYTLEWHPYIDTSYSIPPADKWKSMLILSTCSADIFDVKVREKEIAKKKKKTTRIRDTQE